MNMGEASLTFPIPHRTLYTISMKIAVIQINTTVGDFEGNSAKILDGLRWAEKKSADLAVFPELAICGYPPRDLLEKPSFVQRSLMHVEEIAKKMGDVAIALGFISINETADGRGLFNSACLIHEGEVKCIQHKTLLPEYDVFDEGRHFEPAHKYEVYSLKGKKIGLSLCEDLWSRHEFGGRRLYRHDPIEKIVEQGADIIINLSASPYALLKQPIRRQLVCSAASRFDRPVVYCNLVGGNDELVFDGRSLVADNKGRIVHEGKSFAEDSFIVDIDNMKPIEPSTDSAEEEVLQALILGLRDYMRKCGFHRAVMGLSGGVDSAVVAAIASQAIGSANVNGVLMPSPYSSPGSVRDAECLASNLGISTVTMPIDSIYESYRRTLGYAPKAKDVSLAEENIQARIRGNILMAISNRDGSLVISTGNKSELSVGYCTLYGDMAGGFALISDIPKTMVYAIARHINKRKEVIPQSIIDKPPSAELSPGQKDQDVLPPYEVLDRIIRLYVEERLGADAIMAEVSDRKTVAQVIKLIDTNEYKRRQAPPGIKITSKAFGLGRRFPIAWKP